MRKVDLVIVGGGPAGLAAAVEARSSGIDDIVILEREKELGGILQQCVHTGFGLRIFGEELTGPEYAGRFIEQIEALKIRYYTDTMVMSISKDRTITALSGNAGLLKLEAKAIVLAMGCRERTRGALNIPGTRPAGIYTAGTAQRFVNMEGYLPGRKVVILGSGDIGLIMARRLTLEGAEVKMVCELQPQPGGLKRNIVQCLEDFGIPLLLNHTVVKIHGKDRLEGVTIARVDKDRKPIEESFEYIECDTLLLSVGLIPECELPREAGISIDTSTGGLAVHEDMGTSADGIFACGNVVKVHDLVDNVTEQGRLAGRSAAAYIRNKKAEGSVITGNKKAEADGIAEANSNLAGKKIISEKSINREKAGAVNVSAEKGVESIGLTCIVCPLGCNMTVKISNGEICSVEGNRCPRGLNYAWEECLNPTRTVTTTVRVDGGSLPLVSVKSERPVPKALVMDCVKAVRDVTVRAPIRRGDIVFENILGTGINMIACRNISSSYS